MATLWLQCGCLSPIRFSTILRETEATGLLSLRHLEDEKKQQVSYPGLVTQTAWDLREARGGEEGGKRSACSSEEQNGTWGDEGGVRG